MIGEGPLDNRYEILILYEYASHTLAQEIKSRIGFSQKGSKLSHNARISKKSRRVCPKYLNEAELWNILISVTLGLSCL